MPSAEITSYKPTGNYPAGLRIGLLLVCDDPAVNRFGQRQISNPSTLMMMRVSLSRSELTRARKLESTGDRPNQTPVSLDWWATKSWGQQIAASTGKVGDLNTLNASPISDSRQRSQMGNSRLKLRSGVENESPKANCGGNTIGRMTAPFASRLPA